MRRIDPSPKQVVRRQDVFSFNPRAWRDSLPQDDLTQPIPSEEPLRDQAVSATENEPPPGPGNESADASDGPSWKYALDTTCILLALPIWLPVMLCVMLWIKIASPGPIFFRQERVGHRGKRFM